MAEISEITLTHPDIGAIVCRAGTYTDNQYEAGTIPDKKISIVIKKTEGVLKRIEALRLELIKTGIPSIFTFELDNGDKLKGCVTEIKIRYVRKYSVKLDLFGGGFMTLK